MVCTNARGLCVMLFAMLIAIASQTDALADVEANAQDVKRLSDFWDGKTMPRTILETIARLDKFTQPIKRQLKKSNIDVDFFAGVLQGYDNNVNLNPDRKKDGFLETSLDTQAVYNYTDDLRLSLENYTTSVLYYTENEANFVDVYNKICMESDLFDDFFTIGADYALENAIFPNDEDGSYLGSYMGAFLKQKLFSNLYHKIRYQYLYRRYSHDKTLHSDGYRTENLREDDRHEIDYEWGMHIGRRAILKTALQLYHNDSNYEYFKYYDYWSFRVRPSLMLKLFNKLYTNASFAYRQRRYTGRLSSENDQHVYDDTYSFKVSALYDLTKSFTVVFSYTYRENASNEPLQKYSGSILTAGMYYSF